MEVLLSWLEGSALGVTLRSLGVWTYAVLNLSHILGVSTLFGSMLLLDLRLLGAWRSVSIAALEKPIVPLALAGFVVAATSGLCMLSVNGTEYLGNPFLLIKLGAVALGGLNAVVLQFLPAWRRRTVAQQPQHADAVLAWVGGVSLTCWIAAVAAGRMIGYW